jgi:hypothetical protein
MAMAMEKKELNLNDLEGVAGGRMALLLNRHVCPKCSGDMASFFNDMTMSQVYFCPKCEPNFLNGHAAVV